MKKHITSYWDSFSFVGLITATLLFAVSVSPSLLPRNFLVQGLLSGFSLAIGYALGVALVALYQFLELQQPTGKTQRIAKWIIVGCVAVVFIAFVWRMTFWQNSIRERMEMPPVQTAYPYRMSAIAIVFGAILVSAFRWFLWAGNYVSQKLQRIVPRRIASFLGFALIAVVLFFLTNDLIAAKVVRSADAFFLNLDEVTDDDTPAPESTTTTGGPGSLVAWETIGRQGKLFLTTGPSPDDIAVFREQPEKPLRVYVGMRSADSMKERAKLALEELIRVGGFDRSVLVVATPTGTGWLDPSAVDSLEYLHGGDTAIVSMQYSYLPSWITILVDPKRSIESASALFTEVYAYWKTLPEDSRPHLYLHGLSLGSLGSEESADLFTIFEAPIQGSVWSGPPFPSHNWRRIMANRNAGTPPWQPEIGDSRMVRFTTQSDHLDSDKPWGPIRNVYIQHASDPMIWFSPDLAWSRPDWLGEKRGPDVSPYLSWYPIVTFLQVAFDLPMATSVPIGYGHNYAPSSYIDSWMAVTQPTDWTDDEILSLKEMFVSRDTPKP